ncbi:RDD family protein [Streptomyces huasconensis]|uniref:RDD family protein n=1 Tax=Streptomyces huasconensis TaxID=1854574 RepID=UPI0033C03241
MSAPTPAPGDDRPREGYYPDPSIPGYVRYWNGAAWVPGTSRPAPSDGEPLPAPPGTGPAAGAALAPPPAVEETGPHFFDEDPVVGGQDQHGARPEPATAWQADATRQSGLGGEQERRISWGAPGQADPRVPSEAAPRAETPDAGPGAAPEPPADESNPGTVMIRAVRPGAPKPGAASKPAAGEGTVTFRRPTGPVKPADAAAAPTPSAAPTSAPRTDGTMAIRAMRPASEQREAQAATPQQAAPAQAAAPAQPAVPQQAQAPAPAPAPQPQPAPQPTVPQQGGAPAPSTPVTAGPGGGSQSWAQQVHQLAGAAQVPQQGDGPPVVPWKPVTEDPFLAAARAQASARPAGLGRRLAARLIDSVALAAVTGAAALPLGAEAADHVDSKIDAAKLSGEKTTVWLLDGTTAGYLGIILTVLLLFGVVYEALPTAKWGRTLGKKVCGIEVRDIEEHEPPTFAAALRRWLVYSVPGLLVVGVVGVLWCLFDKPWRQCWHDKAANTFVAG